jgi:hypothetical protein
MKTIVGVATIVMAAGGATSQLELPGNVFVTSGFRIRPDLRSMVSVTS